MLNRSLALTRQIQREYPISQIELWQQPGLVAGIALTLLAFPLERRLPHSLRRSIRRWFVRWFLYQITVRSLAAPGADGQDCPWKATSRKRSQPRVPLSVRRKYHQRNHPELCGDE